MRLNTCDITHLHTKCHLYLSKRLSFEEEHTYKVFAWIKFVRILFKLFVHLFQLDRIKLIKTVVFKFIFFILVDDKDNDNIFHCHWFYR